MRSAHFISLKLAMAKCEEIMNFLSKVAGCAVAWPADPRVIGRHIDCINMFIKKHYFSGGDSNQVNIFLNKLTRKCHEDDDAKSELNSSTFRYMLDVAVACFPGTESAKCQYLNKLYNSIDLDNPGYKVSRGKSESLRDLLAALCVYADHQRYRVLLNRLVSVDSASLAASAVACLRALETHGDAANYFSYRRVMLSDVYINFIYTPHIFTAIQKLGLTENDVSGVNGFTIAALLSVQGQLFVERNPTILRHAAQFRGQTISPFLSQHGETIMREQLATFEQICKYPFEDLKTIVSSKGVFFLRTGKLNLERPSYEQDSVLSKIRAESQQHCRYVNARATLFGGDVVEGASGSLPSAGANEAITPRP